MRKLTIASVAIALGQFLFGDNIVGRLTQIASPEIVQVKKEQPRLRVEITSPADNSTFSSGTPLPLAASVTPADSKITQVDFKEINSVSLR